MPRDLKSEKSTLAGMAPLAPLSREPETDAPPASSTSSYRDIVSGGEHSAPKPDESALQETVHKEPSCKLEELAPLVETLNITHLDNCVTLEEAACPPSDTASREKLEYRLYVCGELFLGLFTTQPLPKESDTLRKEGTEITSSLTLIAYINATKTTNDTIADDDMAFPATWKSSPGSDTQLGNKVDGRTIALHSLAVLPAYQKLGLGSTLLKAYLQRMQAADVADKVALLAHDHLVPFYERFGFVNRGRGKATFGGGNWIDMVLDFAEPGVPKSTFED